MWIDPGGHPCAPYRMMMMMMMIMMCWVCERGQEYRGRLTKFALPVWSHYLL